MTDERPSVYLIGGPNGAGKTTMALSLLPRFLDTHEFVNADEIARGLNPLNPRSADFMAGRMMIDRIKALIEAKTSFAFETTCAGRHHIQTLQDCAAAGYKITLIFLWLPSPEFAIDRVALRVRQGGHNITKDVIVRRYHAGLRNLINVYLPRADNGFIIRAAAHQSHQNYAVIAQKLIGEDISVLDNNAWMNIKMTAGE